MRVKANWAAVKRTTWREYLIRFVLGGAITVTAGVLAERFGPKFGGLFLAFPAIFPASVTLVEKHQQEKKRKHGMTAVRRGREAAALDAMGAVLGSIGLMAFAVVMWRGLYHFSAIMALLIAVAAWLTVSLGLWMLRRAS
jgi:Protein of unknown function (DUF3147)